MSSTVAESTAADLIHRIEQVLLEAERSGQAVEVDPHRGSLFELFVMADAMGGLAEGAEPDLSADAVAKQLAARWDLARNVGAGIAHPSQLPPAQQKRLATLWSFMRMWMEWTYAWERWREFHPPADASGL